jgi:class 3 adenylate cyclase
MHLAKKYVGPEDEGLVKKDDLKWMGFWARPYHMLGFHREKQTHKKLNEFYTDLNLDFIKTRIGTYMKNFRILALVTAVAVSIFVYQDVMRKDNYSNYCGKMFKTKQLCESPTETYGLCRWDGNICIRNTNVTVNECSWYFDDNEITRKRVDTMFFNAMLARFAVLVPISIIIFALTFSKWFKEPENILKWNRQLLVGLLIWVLGCAVVALQWLSGNPGTGMMICWIFLAMNVSYLIYVYRVMIMIVLAVMYACAIYFPWWMQFRTVQDLCDTPIKFTGTRFLYIFFSIICLAVPLMTRESYMRKSFYRKKNVNTAKKELEGLKHKTQNILEQFLPPLIVTRLMKRDPMEHEEIADRFDCASVLFTDMKGFTAYSSQVEPKHLVEFLNHMYQRFDKITDRTEMYKVEIIGDAYYCVSGVPMAQSDHAARAAYSALKMLEEIEEMKEKDKTLKDAEVTIRIGIHSDEVVAGVVGIQDPRYHLFGTTPQIANYMESEGTPSRVHCSEATYQSLMDENNYSDSCEYDKNKFSCERRTGNKVDLSKRGLGIFQTYYINDYSGVL